MAKKLPYLTQRRDTRGWFFYRRVPKDLVETVGLTYWRELLALDLSTARRLLPQKIIDTDELITRLRGGVVAPLNNAITKELDRELLRGQPPEVIYQDHRFFGTPEQAVALSELPPIELSGTKTVMAYELIELAKRLKQPHTQTELAWKKAVDEFTTFLGHSNLNLVTKEDAQRFRDHLLERLKVSTIRTRCNYLKGMFNLGCEEGVLDINPFTGITKRLRPEQTVHVDVDFGAVDEAAKDKLPLIEYQVYQLLRYSGCRLAEVLGIEGSDIDLDANVISITPKEDRPLKTPSSARVIPIHPELLPLAKELSRTDRPFIQFYHSQTTRWGGGIVWKHIIGTNPHSLRHHAVSCMRSAGVAETVIGAVVGHRVATTTSKYGTVDIALKRAAVMSIR